jgi:hypothetical protein
VVPGRGEGLCCVRCQRRVEPGQLQYSIQLQSERERVACEMHATCFNQWYAAISRATRRELALKGLPADWVLQRGWLH